MKAFKKIDINGDGFISHSELKKIMTTVSSYILYIVVYTVYYIIVYTI